MFFQDPKEQPTKTQHLGTLKHNTHCNKAQPPISDHTNPTLNKLRTVIMVLKVVSVMCIFRN